MNPLSFFLSCPVKASNAGWGHLLFNGFSTIPIFRLFSLPVNNSLISFEESYLTAPKACSQDMA